MLNEKNTFMILTDKALASDKLLERTERILDGGATALIYQRDMAGMAYVDDAKRLEVMARERGVAFFVCDDVALASELGAGLFVSSFENRKLLADFSGTKALVVKNSFELTDAKTLGIDFAIFRDTFDKDERLVADKEMLFELGRLGVPLYAMGNVSENNVSLLAGAGLSGVVVSESLYALPNPTLATKRLGAKIEVVLSSHLDLKGALFDVDGVLTDTLAVWQNLAPNYLSQNGHAPGPDLIEILAEKTLPEQIGYIKHNYSFYDGVGDVLNMWLYYLDSYYKKEAKAKDDVKAFLSALSEKGVIKKAYTISPSELIQTLLKATGLYSLLDGLESGWNDKLEAQDIALYDRAAGTLALEKSATVVFEDSLFALRAAKKAGYKVACLYDENHPAKEWKLLVKEADLAFMSYKEAIHWLG